MHIIFLGTASCNPTEYRGVSSLAIRFESGDIWLVDCGEGTQVQMQKSSIKFGKVKKIFLTHLHGDHIFGLPGLLASMGTMTERMDFVLELYGPRGLAKYVRESLNLSRSPLSFKYKVIELVPQDSQYPGNLMKDWPVMEVDTNQHHPQEIQSVSVTASAHEDPVWNLIDSHDECTVKASRIEHRIPCFGYVFTENDRPGTINVDYLKGVGIPPGPLYAKLKRGEAVTAPNGTTVNPKDCIGPDKKGRKATILGDTWNPNCMTKIAMHSDVLVHEATLEDGLKEKAVSNGHSTPSMAVEFSHKIAAKTLILNHYSQRYRSPHTPVPKALAQEQVSSTDVLLEEAKNAVKNYPGFECSVIASRDLMTHEVTL
nr:PREDICTED: zinc phosphodiesterase ELAC protein 1-like [Bemisia tabaci]